MKERRPRSFMASVAGWCPRGTVGLRRVPGWFANISLTNDLQGGGLGVRDRPLPQGRDAAVHGHVPRPVWAATLSGDVCHGQRGLEDGDDCGGRRRRWAGSRPATIPTDTAPLPGERVAAAPPRATK